MSELVMARWIRLFRATLTIQKKKVKVLAVVPYSNCGVCVCACECIVFFTSRVWIMISATMSPTKK